MSGQSPRMLVTKDRGEQKVYSVTEGGDWRSKRVSCGGHKVTKCLAEDGHQETRPGRLLKLPAAALNPCTRAWSSLTKAVSAGNLENEGEWEKSKQPPALK